jgi:Tol biopolymer transport system component
MSSQRLLGSLVMVLVFVSLAGSRTAEATFPGGEGDLAFESDRDGNGEIYHMGFDGRGQFRFTSNRAEDASPAWQMRGGKFAYASDRSGSWDIYLYTFPLGIGGFPELNLTTHPATDIDPAWSAAGSQLVFTTNRDGNNELYIIATDGSGLRRLTTNGSDDGAASFSAGPPSPDLLQPGCTLNQNLIAFESDRTGNYDIFVMKPDGSEQTNLTRNPASEFNPNWSPDCTRIAFDRRNASGNYDIFVMDADGTDQVRLTTSPAEDSDPVWSPRGTEIGFVTNRDGNYEIYAMKADGTEQRNLTGSLGADLAPDWRADICCFGKGDVAPPVDLAGYGGRTCPSAGTRFGGTPGKDEIMGTPGNDVICGRGGSDTIRGRGGNDVIDGGFGKDNLLGGAGKDKFHASDGQGDSVDGGAGRDRAHVDKRLDVVKAVEAPL